jgi:hypothetical protein
VGISERVQSIEVKQYTYNMICPGLPKIIFPTSSIPYTSG